VGAIDGGHGREEGGGGEEGVRVEIVRRRRGRDQPHDTRTECPGGGGDSGGGSGGDLEARGCVQATNKAREGGDDDLDEAAEALNLSDGEGRHAGGVGVAHPP
jgi:hypothetical protein